MQRTFDAHFVSVEEDANLWIVRLSDAEFNAKRYLLLQREKAPSAQDVEFGLNGYQIEVDDQVNSCFGGIASIELFRDHIVVGFEDDALSVLIDEKPLVVELQIRERQLDQLRECLAKIFRGYECYVDKSA
jgi:hypothetical protein